MTFYRSFDGKTDVLRKKCAAITDEFVRTSGIRYRKDPLCTGYKYTNRAVLTVWEADRDLKNYKGYECKNPELPILSITGVDDPVTGFEKGLQDSVKNLRRVGYKDIRTIVYPKMKHEVLNEEGKDRVYADALSFLEEVSPCTK